MTVIFSAAGYGRGTVIVQPGVDFPQDPAWFKETPTSRGSEMGGVPVREARTIAIRFINGAADLSDPRHVSGVPLVPEIIEKLADYLLDRKRQLAHRNPQPIARRPDEIAAIAQEEQGPRYHTPIAVGEPPAPRKRGRLSKLLGA
jgi:hypothetical protein